MTMPPTGERKVVVSGGLQNTERFIIEGGTGGAAGGMYADPALAQARLKARTAQMEAQAVQQLNMSYLALNMSLLGLSFTYQNVYKMMNAGKTAELQELQLKEKKSAADKKRIEELKREQIQQEKFNSILTGTIALTQMLITVSQVLITIKGMQAQASARSAQMEYLDTQAKAAGIAPTMGLAGGETALTVAKSGWLAPLMAILLLGAIGLAVGGVMAQKANLFAANGAFIPQTPGGRLAVVGEGKSDEIISPVPQMRNTFREVLREGGGGGNVYNIYAIDSQSLAEAISRKDLDFKLMGVKQ